METNWDMLSSRSVDAPPVVDLSDERTIRIDYPDADLKLRVSRFLNSRHFSALQNLDVEVLHGEVTVSGKVDSFYEKQVAINACQHVAGVLSLVDEIRVRPEPAIGLSAAESMKAEAKDWRTKSPR